MNSSNDISFSIKSLSPATLPQSRLSEYLKELSALYGNKENVFFKAILPGSAVLASYTNTEEAYNNATKRVEIAQLPDAPNKLRDTSEKLNKMLAEDGSSGHIEFRGNVIPFPGIDAQQDSGDSAPLLQSGSIQGELVRLGGTDATIPVWIKDHSGETIKKIQTSKEIAQELCSLMYKQIRLNGTGKWVRTLDKGWVLKQFEVSSFEELEEHSLHDLVSKLRSVPNNGWNESDNPFRDLNDLRD